MKPNIELINKTGDFLREALCVDGEVKFIKYTTPENGFNCNGMLYQLEDSKRGLFFIGIYSPID